MLFILLFGEYLGICFLVFFFQVNRIEQLYQLFFYESQSLLTLFEITLFLIKLCPTMIHETCLQA